MCASEGDRPGVSHGRGCEEQKGEREKGGYSGDKRPLRRLPSFPIRLFKFRCLVSVDFL